MHISMSAPFPNRRHFLRGGMSLWVLGMGASVSAGSYDDFFVAVKRDDAKGMLTLLQRGFDPNTLSPNGEHALFVALREPSDQVVQLLLTWPKVDLDVRNRHDETPLMMACLKGQLAVVQQLLAKDVDVNKPGWTPLHYAATRGHLPVMQLLLDHHAYIDAESPNGSTPLMLAAQYGSLEAVQLLLDAGADATIKNALDLTAIDFAQRAARQDAAQAIAAAIRRKLPGGRW